MEEKGGEPWHRAFAIHWLGGRGRPPSIRLITQGILRVSGADVIPHAACLLACGYSPTDRVKVNTSREKWCWVGGKVDGEPDAKATEAWWEDYAKAR